MTPQYYTLDEKGTPVLEPDYEKWEKWFLTTNRSVARDLIATVSISTVFLAFSQYDGPVSLWETIVQGGALNQVKDRCHGNRQQAEAMHARMVTRVRSHQVVSD